MSALVFFKTEQCQTPEPYEFNVFRYSFGDFYRAFRCDAVSNQRPVV